MGNDCIKQREVKKCGSQESEHVCVDKFFHNPLAHTHFNMFVDQWTSAKIPEKFLLLIT